MVFVSRKWFDLDADGCARANSVINCLCLCLYGGHKPLPSATRDFFFIPFILWFDTSMLYVHCAPSSLRACNHASVMTWIEFDCSTHHTMHNSPLCLCVCACVCLPFDREMKKKNSHNSAYINCDDAIETISKNRTRIGENKDQVRYNGSICRNFILSAFLCLFFLRKMCSFWMEHARTLMVALMMTMSGQLASYT